MLVITQTVKVRTTVCVLGGFFESQKAKKKSEKSETQEKSVKKSETTSLK